jgi:hypothetical protein
MKYTLGLGSQLNLFFFSLYASAIIRKRSGNERLGIESIELRMLKDCDIIEPPIGRLYLNVTSVLPRHQNCGGPVLTLLNVGTSASVLFLQFRQLELS